MIDLGMMTTEETVQLLIAIIELLPEVVMVQALEEALTKDQRESIAADWEAVSE